MYIQYLVLFTCTNMANFTKLLQQLRFSLVVTSELYNKYYHQ